jgi:hypothetical protein
MKHVMASLGAAETATPELPAFGGIKVTTTGLGSGVEAVLERQIATAVGWAVAATYTSDQTATAVAETTVSAKHRLRLTTPPGVAGVRAVLSGLAV